MEIILLAVACIAISVAIVLYLVSHRRGNRLGKGLSVDDLRRAERLQKVMDRINNCPNPFKLWSGNIVSNEFRD